MAKTGLKQSNVAERDETAGNEKHAGRDEWAFAGYMLMTGGGIASSSGVEGIPVVGAYTA